MHPSDYGAGRPWWRTVWETIKPPAKDKRQESRFSTKQKSILKWVWIVLAVLAAAGGGTYYFLSAPDRAEAKFQEGMLYMGPGKYPRAIENFTSAIGIWSGHARAYLERGNARQILGKSDDALADFEQAAAVDPNLAEAYTARGTILRDRGDSRKAIDEFSKSIKIRPTMDGYFQRGQLWAKIGEHQKAIEDYDLAIAQERKAPYIYRARADSRRALGDIAGYEEDRNTARNFERKF